MTLRHLGARYGLDLAVLALALVAFGSLAFYQLRLPGLYYDEAQDVVPTMQLLRGQPVDLLHGAGIHLGGRDFPVMVMDYVGTANTYAALPFFAVFGPGVEGVRAMTVVGAMLTLALTYVVGRQLFGRAAGAAAALLLAVQPSFVFWSRQGVHVTSLLTVFSMGALASLLAWRKSGKAFWLCLAALALGAGLGAKVLFLWFIAALALVALMSLVMRLAAPGARGRRLRALREAVGLRPWEPFAAVACFAAGAAPLILYNVWTGDTLDVLLDNASVSQSGVDNSDFLHNFHLRLDTFRVALDGDHFWFLGGLHAASLYPWFLLGAAIVAVGVLLLRPQARGLAAPVALVLTLVGVMLLESSFTISDTWPAHVYMFLPLVALVFGAALFLLWRHGGMSRVPFALGVAALALLFAQSLQVDYQYHRDLRETGGRRTHSDAIYRLSEYLDDRTDYSVLAMDWGIRYSVQLLTDGKVDPREVFYYSPEPPELFYHQVYGAMMDARPQLYVFHALEPKYPRLDQFIGFARQYDREPRLEQTITERDGTPAFLIYSVPSGG